AGRAARVGAAIERELRTTVAEGDQAAIVRPYREAEAQRGLRAGAGEVADAVDVDRQRLAYHAAIGVDRAQILAFLTAGGDPRLHLGRVDLGQADAARAQTDRGDAVAEAAAD